MSNFQRNAPKDYVCPICLGVKGIENNDTLIRQPDIVYKDEAVTILVNSFFMPSNEGHVIVVPNGHYENIYDLPSETGHKIFDVAQKMAKAMKQAYSADGITIRQNNEPAGDQHAFHYHLHVFPRYTGDKFNEAKPEDKYLADTTEKAQYADKLRKELSGVK